MTEIDEHNTRRTEPGTRERQAQRSAEADTIDLDRADPGFARELIRQPGGEAVRACFTCRTCTASCPISEVNRAFNPMRIIRMALYGLRKEVLGSAFLWLCASCYACQERCPQGVRIADFMTLLKNLAVGEGRVPPGVKAQLDLVRGEGRIYPVDDFDNKKRAKMGLPELPTSCASIRNLFPSEKGSGMENERESP